MSLKIFFLKLMLCVLSCISSPSFLIAASKANTQCQIRFQKSESSLVAQNKRAVALNALANVLAHLFLTTETLSADVLDSWFSGSDPVLQNFIERLDTSMKSTAVRQALGAVRKAISLRVSEWDQLERAEFNHIIESWKELKQSQQLEHDQALSETRDLVGVDVLRENELVEEVGVASSNFSIGKRKFRVLSRVLPVRSTDYEVHELMDNGRTKELEKPYSALDESMQLVNHISVLETDSGQLLAVIRGERDVDVVPAVFELRKPRSDTPLVTIRLSGVAARDISTVKVVVVGTKGLFEIESKRQHTFIGYFDLNRQSVGLLENYNGARTGEVTSFGGKEVYLPAVLLDQEIPAVSFKVYGSDSRMWSSGVLVKLDLIPVTSFGLIALEIDKSLYLFTVVKLKDGKGVRLVGARVLDANGQEVAEDAPLTSPEKIDHSPNGSVQYTEAGYKLSDSLMIDIPFDYYNFYAIKYFELRGTPYLLYVCGKGILVLDVMTRSLHSQVEMNLSADFGTIVVDLDWGEKNNLFATVVRRNRQGTWQSVVSLIKKNENGLLDSQKMVE